MVDSWLDAFVRWMDAGGADAIWVGCLCAVLFRPIVTLAHEAGHAAVGLLRTEGLVQLRVGRPTGWVRGRLGRLEFELSPLLGRDILGSALTLARMTRGERIAYAVAGPAAELLFLIACVPLIGQVGGFHDALVIAWTICFLVAASNLVPRRVAGFSTDGARLRDALRADPSEASLKSPPGSTAQALINELTDTTSRWIVLVTDEGASIRTHGRGKLLNGAAWALGLRGGPSEKTESAFSHAFAGWCWRECEHGDPERIREAVARAWTQATRTGHTDTELIATAAAVLAADRDLGLASPGSSDIERRGFLARAFRELQLPEHRRALAEEDRLFCFRYGVALHDVERLAL